MLTRLNCSQTANHSLHLRPDRLSNSLPLHVPTVVRVQYSATAAAVCTHAAVCCWCCPQAVYVLVLRADICKRRSRGKDTKKPQEMRCSFGRQCCAVWRLASSPVYNGVVGWSYTAAVVLSAAQTASAEQGLQFRAAYPRSAVCIQPPPGCPPLARATAAIWL